MGNAWGLFAPSWFGRKPRSALGAGEDCIRRSPTVQGVVIRGDYGCTNGHVCCTYMLVGLLVRHVIRQVSAGLCWQLEQRASFVATHALSGGVAAVKAHVTNVGVLCFHALDAGVAIGRSVMAEHPIVVA